MAELPDGLLAELRGRLAELAVATSERSDGRETVTVAVGDLSLVLSAFEVDAVHLAVLDPELATADPISALVAAAAALRLATELDLVRPHGGDPSASAALARASELGQRVHDALVRVARDFADAGEDLAAERVAGAAAPLAAVVARARRASGRAAPDANDGGAADDDPPAPARRRWWPWSRP